MGSTPQLGRAGRRGQLYSLPGQLDLDFLPAHKPQGGAHILWNDNPPGTVNGSSHTIYATANPGLSLTPEARDPSVGQCRPGPAAPVRSPVDTAVWAG